MPLSIATGDGPYGLPVMKFALTYEGELRSNDDYRRKWEIRKQFHPQLQELWRVNPALVALIQEHRYIPQTSYQISEIHHSKRVGSGPQAPPAGPYIDTCAPITIGKRTFLPLVRESLSLRCSLKICFLRKEQPGRIYQGGDLDNRLKTLFDSLACPNEQQIVDDPAIDDPIHCLLEDDSAITNCNIETHRLLARPNGSRHDVHLLIEVDVRVTDARLYNTYFMGD